MDILDLSRIFFALIAVLGMIGLCAMIAKKAGFISGAVGLQKKRRLAIVETLPLDARRRAAIIRCDDREHLVILGQTSETLIEANIPAIAGDVATGSATIPDLPRAGGDPALTPFWIPAFAGKDGVEGVRSNKTAGFAEAFLKLQKFNPYQRRVKDEAKAA